MDILDNSPQRWNRFWASGATNFYLNLPASNIIENFVRHQLHFKAINKLLGSFSLDGKDIIEFGSGTGSNSFYLAQSRKVGTVTLVDFSEKALARAKTESCPCPAVKIQEDILKFSPEKSYEFVHSTGLVEHVTGRERLLAIKKHAQCVRLGGLVMIWVPIFSLAFKPIEKINRYLEIKEEPFTKGELRHLYKKSGLEIINEGKTVLGALYGILARRNA